jgi:acylphosphatase
MAEQGGRPCGSIDKSLQREHGVSGGESRQRRTVYFRGHVQGVGFRFTTLRIAATCAVDGFVQNLSDGGVLVVTEGTSDEVDCFLRKLEDELSGHIHHSDMTQSAATGEFTGFDIRY